MILARATRRTFPLLQQLYGHLPNIRAFDFDRLSIYIYYSSSMFTGIYRNRLRDNNNELERERDLSDSIEKMKKKKVHCIDGQSCGPRSNRCIIYLFCVYYPTDRFSGSVYMRAIERSVSFAIIQLLRNPTSLCIFYQ